ncbi:hypothetical protein D0C16_13065 [Cellvibrio sp. KY-GH-1]|uniref:ParA family protein n=1 Tax=Cellvibrio sp. KY-GH-1 TaxID=2303332 RepID=UPI001245D14A|nr:hypothetical protein [Cellvibrio sp. KY-GH-1]QEY16819.1 hypothetical protein D0C16_13065 [Cellvibrio sp. KY-GH-1]
MARFLLGGFFCNKKADTAGGISRTNIPNLDIVLNDAPYREHIVAFLPEPYANFQRLYVALQALDYDYILIVTQDAKGVVQEPAICAADVLLSPIKP